MLSGRNGQICQSAEWSNGINGIRIVPVKKHLPGKHRILSQTGAGAVDMIRGLRTGSLADNPDMVSEITGGILKIAFRNF